MLLFPALAMRATAKMYKPGWRSDVGALGVHQEEGKRKKRSQVISNLRT